MSSNLIKMNMFDSVDNTKSANQVLPEIAKTLTQQEMLDYMVLVISRRLQRAKAFKGGYMLNQLLGRNSRMTHDVDFSVDSVESYEVVKKILREIAQIFQQRGLIADYKIKESIASRSSGGIDFYNESGAKVLGVDVGLHSLDWGITSYNFTIATIDGFSIERMLSDKIMAILSRKRFRRTKDIYDLWAITNQFDFDAKLVLEFINKRGDAEWQNIPFSDIILVEYEKAWEKLVLQTPDGYDLEKPEFPEVLHRFNSIAFTLKEGQHLGVWNHKVLRFEYNDEV